MVLFIDIAPQNYSFKIIRKYIEERKDVLKMICFPTVSSEFKGAEDFRRRRKYDLRVSKYYPRFTDLKISIAE